MTVKDLKIGDDVKIYGRGIRNFGLKCQGKICELNPLYILIERGYKERFDIIDFRTRHYRLFMTSGSEVKFSPLPDKAAIEAEMKRKTHEEYFNSPIGKNERLGQERQKNGTAIKWEKVKQLLDVGKTPEEVAEELKYTIRIVKGLVTRYKYNIREDEEEMAMMTRDVVKKMADEGMDVESIAKQFEASYPNAKPSVIKAKVTMLLSGKSNRPKKEKMIQPEPGTEEYIMKHDASAENLPVPNPIPDVQVEQVEKMFKKSDENRIKDGMRINPEFEKAISEIVEEGQLKNDKEALFQRKIKEMEVHFIKRKPLLKPKCLVGELTGRDYIFMDDGVSFCVKGDTVSWEELDNFIEELQAVRDMKSA